MARKKKPFIDRKSAVTYELVHRPKDEQTDENDSSGMFLLRRAGKNTTNVPEVIDPEEVGKRNEEEGYEYNRNEWELGEYGFPDDGHDYSQHLKEGGDGVFVPANKTFEELEQSEEQEKLQELLRERRNNSDLDEVMALLESDGEDDPELKQELEEYLQAPDDEDATAAKDDAADVSLREFEEMLEDDFILRANKGKTPSQSKASQRSRPSKATDRTGGEQAESREARMIDEQFEKLLEEYDDDYSHDGGDDDVESYSDGDGAAFAAGEGATGNLQDQAKANEVLEEAMNEFYEDMSRMKLNEKGSEYARLQHLAADPEEDDNKDLEVVVVKDDDGQRWDCETVLSTYSNLDNHPQVIGLPPARGRPIKLDPRVQAPADYLATKEKATSTQEEPHGSRVRAALSAVRHRGESAAERKDRKERVKAAKRERRSEKKETKLAFRAEMARQGEQAAKSGPTRATVQYD
mmetsp:Transcript_9161/g.27582  ORF Transcript_9161/g.27582 Transcript_9161/m.27582 type:complete len:465 (-) Transcript_9161:1075-2469(-)